MESKKIGKISVEKWNFKPEKWPISANFIKVSGQIQAEKDQLVHALS